MKISRRAAQITFFEFVLDNLTGGVPLRTSIWGKDATSEPRHLNLTPRLDSRSENPAIAILSDTAQPWNLRPEERSDRACWSGVSSIAGTD
jgi:hypothetical protein